MGGDDQSHGEGSTDSAGDVSEISSEEDEDEIVHELKPIAQ